VERDVGDALAKNVITKVKIGIHQSFITNIVKGDTNMNKVEKGSEINFKRWLSRVIALMIILSLMAYGFQYQLKIDLLFDVIILLISVLLLFFLHEYLHYYVALRLGYKPEWYRTRFMMGFEIDTKDRTEEAKNKELGLSSKQKKEKHLKENKIIAVAPYPICLILSLCFLIFGFSFNFNGLFFAGMLGLIGHVFTFTMEAKVIK